MIRARPLLGWGLDTFVTVYPQFRSFPTTKLVNAAHNDYLQLLVETGLAGFALMLWFVIETFRSALSEQSAGMKQRARLAAMIGCTGILVHSLSDFNLHIPANAALFYVLCAIAAAGQTSPSKRRQHRESSRSLVSK
jgi:O-antigen ligase